MEEPYSKHKDRDPRGTVDGIVEMLEQIGLDTEMRWTSHPFEGLCSNRVTIAGTNVGTNGKGTSEQYCLASGYAEFMERLQNNILGSTALSGAEIFERRGFLAAPDERHATPAEIEARHEPVLEEWLATFGVKTREERVALLEGLPFLDYACGDGTLAELPFAASDAKDGGAPRVVWLPAALVYRTCGSNGMAAGNTLEEALVQGLSEIFERYAEAQVLRGKAVPPRVPDEVLEATGLMPTIARIEDGGRYEVRVHDASLGRGYPVIMTTIVDRIRSSIGVKFGAHPSLSVAVERTLTEAFQGRNVDGGTSTNRLASLAESANPRNISNLYINNLGVFPATAFCRESTWDFAPWPSWRGKTNAQMLSHMLEVLRRDGHHMLVRDASHLGKR
ncbi:MAG: YcaO-like family protein [Eggerthellaceae bacterium]|nr:YcaO-like family protein [Eggerthellaceae bacterium]